MIRGCLDSRPPRPKSVSGMAFSSVLMRGLSVAIAGIFPELRRCSFGFTGFPVQFPWPIGFAFPPVDPKSCPCS